MRPVTKGTSPGTYGHWGDASADLKSRIGKYCSYCEMKLTHLPHVEHVVPRNQGGAPVDWENLLFACVHCNSRKRDRNRSRLGYLWPDQHNTHLAFEYPDAYLITAAAHLTPSETDQANALIKLCGLDKNPMHDDFSVKDERWTERDQTWQIALDNVVNWSDAPSESMANCIVSAAIGHGHFSIWMKVFQHVPLVRRKLIEAFPGTETGCYDMDTLPIQHTGRT